MLDDAAFEKRIAAAIVLGELGVKAPEVLEGLARLATSGVPGLQVPALHALARLTARKHLPRILPLVAARDPAVRDAASRAIVGIGEAALPAIRERLASAGPDERRALDGILAELGGKDAFETLLSALAGTEPTAIEGATMAIRLHLKNANAGERRSALAQTKQFYKTQAKKSGNVPTLVAVVKVLGYIADESTLPTLLEYVTDATQPTAVRHEAIIATRFMLGGTGAQRDKAIDALIDAAAENDATIARAALLTLEPVALPESHGARLRKLIDHPDVERARLVIEKLGRQPDTDAAKLLATVLSRAEKRRAELAAPLLAKHAEAAGPLARALIDTGDPDRRWMIRSVLTPLAKKVPAALRKQLLAAAVERLEGGERGWEAYLDVAQAADPESVADAMRDVATRIRKKNPDRALVALTVLCRTEHATDDDRWQRAMLEFARTPRDLNAAARSSNGSLREIAALAERGFDVVGRLKKERALEIDDLYFLGFHFVEQRDPMGSDLLRIVIEKGGRTKLARMAKSKLGLSES